MRKFTDTDGREWILKLTVGVIEKVKAKLNIDLLDPITEERQVVVELSPFSAGNIATFCKLLALLCENQFEANQISSTSFADILDMATLKAAYEAFFEEWSDFFLQLGREDIVEAFRVLKAAMEKEVKNISQAIQGITSPEDLLATTKQLMN